MANALQYLSQYGVLNRIDDTDPGGLAVGVAGGASRYGMIGNDFTFTEEQAKANTDTTVSTYSSTSFLHTGEYKYVKLATPLTITPARGLVVYWDVSATAGADDTVHTVTTDNPGKGSLVAGVLISVATAGKYCVIQTDGLASVKCKATLTQAGAVGQALYVDAATGTLDTLADATSVTNAILATFKAIAREAPANGALKLAYLVNIAKQPKG